MTALEVASTVMAAVAVLLSIVSMLFTRAARRRADAAEIEVTRLLGLAALGEAAVRRTRRIPSSRGGAVVKLTVEATDGALVARLDGYRPGVLDADRAADLFFDAVLAALQPAAPELVSEAPELMSGTPELASEVPVEPTPVVVPDARSEALRRLDEGQDVGDVARALGVPVAIVRRWDADPTWAAS